MQTIRHITNSIFHLPGSVYGAVLVIAGSAVLYLWRLSGGILAYATHGELATINQIKTPSYIWTNLTSFNGIYFGLGHLTYTIMHSVDGARLASVIIGLLTVALVYWVVLNWHGFRLALLTSAIYATNLSVLAMSRHATPFVMQLWIGAALLGGVVFIHRHQNMFGLTLWFLIGAVCLYVPGAIWLVLAYCLLNLGPVKNALSSAVPIWRKSLTFLAGAIVIFPVVAGIIKNHSSHHIAYYLGYNLHGSFVSIARHYGSNLLHFPSDLFVHSFNLSPSYILGHQPLFNLADTVILAIAAYVYVTRWHDHRWRQVLIFIGLSWFVTAFGVLRPYVIIPLAVVAIGTGMAYLLREWYAVFPRNPIARFAGLALMSLVIIYACIYSSRSYYVAWYNNPKTFSRYDIQITRKE